MFIFNLNKNNNFFFKKIISSLEQKLSEKNEIIYEKNNENGILMNYKDLISNYEKLKLSIEENDNIILVFESKMLGNEEEIENLKIKLENILKENEIKNNHIKKNVSDLHEMNLMIEQLSIQVNIIKIIVKINIIYF